MVIRKICDSYQYIDLSYTIIVTMMIGSEKGVHHPEGKILLMNGNVLDCFMKKSRQAAIVQDKVGLDITGNFFQIKRRKQDNLREPTVALWEDLFYQEAFFLYANRDEIFQDSKMFLTPLPFKNGLAYSGASGMNNATLGVYLEWWTSCEKAIIKWKGEIYALTYYIAGSPLSGSNHCAAVTKEGKSVTIHFPNPFSDIWGSFIRINQRYNEAKQAYQAYTLEETISRLRHS